MAKVMDLKFEPIAALRGYFQMESESGIASSGINHIQHTSYCFSFKNKHLIYNVAQLMHFEVHVCKLILGFL